MNRHFQVMIGALCAALLALSGCANEKSTYITATRHIAVVLQGSDKWSILDAETGNVIARDKFKYAPSPVVDDMFYAVADDGRIFYYNVADCNTPVNTEPYGSATCFNEGYAIASKPGEELQIIDKQCNTVTKLSPTVLGATMFTRGRAMIHTELDLYGFVDTRGDTVIAPRLGYAAQFLTDDVTMASFSAPADTAKTLTAIDVNGRELYTLNDSLYRVITPYYAMGVLTVLKKDSVVYLDPEGKEVSNPSPLPKKVEAANYKDGRFAGDGKYMVLKGDRMGLVDADNNILIPFNYRYINNLSPTRFVVGVDSAMFIVDDHGKQVGKARFINYKQLEAQAQAQRGYINKETTAANLLSFFGEDGICGAKKGSTLMDLNGLVGVDATPYVGMNRIDRMLTPLLYTYHFDRDIARPDSAATAAGPKAQFNYDAQLKGVTMRFSVLETAPGTEEDLLRLMTSAMGTKGFRIMPDGSFLSDAGTVVTMGHEKGVFELNYYFNPAEAKTLPRESRSR